MKWVIQRASLLDARSSKWRLSSRESSTTDAIQGTYTDQSVSDAAEQATSGGLEGEISDLEIYLESFLESLFAKLVNILWAYCGG